MLKRINYILCAILLVFVSLPLFSTGTQEKKSEKLKMEFFQNKQEAIGTFNELIARFEKKYPNITIVQNNVPEFETVLMTRLTKNDIPALIGMGGTADFGNLARAGVLKNFAGDPVLDLINKAYLEIIKNETHPGGTYGLPYSANANTTLYNKTKFEELGIKVPKTWDEFVAAAQKSEAAGQTPFYLTLKTAWTAMVPFNSLAANLQGDDFIEKRLAGKTSFQERYFDVAKKMLTIVKYGEKDKFGADYRDGNTSFAKGKSVMYLQGVWAIGDIKKANPNIKLGVFALPALNDANKNRLVSGVDTLFALSKDPKYAKGKLFIDFMLEPENAKYYIDKEKEFSTVKGVLQEDPVMDGIKVNFKTGRIAGFPDHSYPPGMQVPNIIQAFLHKGDVNSFLKTMDDEWDKVQKRSK
ncbi:MAG: extracellular solute-binding protein [Spirochaetales bacterium]|nr:extracellular solute-binding protein [Spirochaetales bacterium]